MKAPSFRGLKYPDAFRTGTCVRETLQLFSGGCYKTIKYLNTAAFSSIAHSATVRVPFRHGDYHPHRTTCCCVADVPLALASGRENFKDSDAVNARPTHPSWSGPGAAPKFSD